MLVIFVNIKEKAPRLTRRDGRLMLVRFGLYEKASDPMTVTESGNVIVVSVGD
jgi:hypothetical protein